MKVPNIVVPVCFPVLSLSRLQNEGSQPAIGVWNKAPKSIKATE